MRLQPQQTPGLALSCITTQGDTQPTSTVFTLAIHTYARLVIGVRNDGNAPPSPLFAKPRKVNRVRTDTDDGIVPVKALLDRSSAARLARPPRVLEIVPVIELSAS